MARRGAKRRWRWIAPMPPRAVAVVCSAGRRRPGPSPYWPNGECVRSEPSSRSSTLAVYEAQLGVRFDEVLGNSKPVQDLALSKLTPFLDTGVRVIFNIEFEDDHPNLREGAEVRRQVTHISPFPAMPPPPTAASCGSAPYTRAMAIGTHGGSTPTRMQLRRCTSTRSSTS